MGEILDVDMDLNMGAGQFQDCQKVVCSAGSMVDLQNTITHEAGHLLGLGHSSVAGATMQPQAIGGLTAETSKRTLAQDDIDGYCALDLPGFSCTNAACTCPPPPIYKSTTTHTGCSCSSVGTRGRALGWLAPLVLLGAAASVRLRRRVRSGG
jgi:MYXO-CTERM domain-containing protein